MRLATLSTATGERVVAVHDGKYIDINQADPLLSGSIKDILSHDEGLSRTRVAAERGLAAGAFVAGRLLAPIQSPGKVICIGLNYRDHAAESGMAPPPEPVVFSKFSQSVIGPDDAIRLPAVCHKVDYEAELIVVIGKRGKLIPESEAGNYIAGYMNGNDVSARDWQLEKPGKQWLLGKTPDTFAPTGPWLVSADEIPDAKGLSIQLRLNGQTMQNSTTRELIFGVSELIAYVSQVVTLEPGDLIFTGTPPGVGMARKPPVFLKPGDTCEVEIAGLGILRNPVVAEA
ncbi:MAG TPA: fumarylacetoacetate hydrolase family protein [Planctomycetaceae bacterium]|nr:fumarylacetoacetate hydrolase family protein [Planctomycetaceae bacterium]